MNAKLPLITALACMLALPLHAQQDATQMDAARLAHALDRLSNTARVLYIAAHPDDENTRLLTYLANGRHVSARYLSMTRGGGGQNLIGSEQDALLDVLRTQELLAARRLDGATQRFTRARDFGYSKSAQETLQLWDHDTALSDVVYALRSFQPDVVFTRFDEQPPNHGHHTASAILAREAFSAAADPKRFPEQLQAGLSTWQAKRLLYNWPFWRDQQAPEGALALDVGAYDPRFGLSFGELAARSRSQHKSQGFGAAPERGVILERFVHVAGERAHKDVLEGVGETWAARFAAAGAAVDSALRDARHALHRDHPERAAVPLAAARRALAALPDGDPRVQSARRAAEELALAASGVFVRAVAPRAVCTPGARLPVKVELIVRRPSQLTAAKLSFPDGQVHSVPEPLTDKRELSAEVACAADAAVTAPYWLREPPLAGRYAQPQAALDDPAGPAPLAVSAELSLNGQTLSLRAPIVYAYTDRVQGEREQNVLIAPPLTITPTRQAILFPNGASNVVSLRVRASADAQSGRVFLELPPGYRSEPAEQNVSLPKAGDESVLTFKLLAPADALQRAPQPAQPVVEVAGRRYSLRQDVIDYPHVPLQVVLQPAHLTLTPLALEKPHGLIGYVEGSGDSIAADLAHVGARVELLTDGALMQTKLSRFSAIVLGVRSYNTRDVLRAANPRLMKYVEDGGVLVVQYVTRSSLSPLDVPVGPHALDIGRGRVTDENAAVTALIPDHPLLQTPHRIGPKDWEGWVQERGLYFAERWDPRYQSLLEMSDPNEPSASNKERGALLALKHGRGRYVYTGLAFFRQLPAGVPGAYRLLLNLLAAPSGTAP